ncbi:DNA repair protein, putative [Babesia ovis]|uniref:DNA repair protein, putative n=1 Tax=Babesia ovis TaxID=5869 RepID=A0A9W5TCW3_BABOV|nr:DNA repair protein, putative [Babesia ovis]
MDKFPFYDLEPKERLAKLKEHFLKFEQDSAKLTVDKELRCFREQIMEAANVEVAGNEALIKCGENLLIEVDPKNIKELLQHIKDVY